MNGLAHEYYIAPSYEQNNASNDDDDNDDYHGDEIGNITYRNVSQPPGRGPVPGLGINYTGPRDVLLEFVILVF